MNKVIFERVNKSDGKKLVNFWNKCTLHYHFLKPLNNKHGKAMYSLIRQVL